MTPQLQASAASGLGGTGGDIQWNMTIPNMGKNGLGIIAWLGREEGGETNPEVINVTYYNGQYADGYNEANRNETGGGLSWFLRDKIPAAGTYLAGCNFQDSPKQAEKKRGVSAAFTNVKNQAPEATAVATGSGGTPSISITPLTNNALVIVSFSWRVGSAATVNWTGATTIVESRGDNSGGVLLAYKIVETPALQSISITVTNPEDWGLSAVSFAMQSGALGKIL